MTKSAAQSQKSTKHFTMPACCLHCPKSLFGIIISTSVSIYARKEQIPDESRLKIADRFYHPGEREYVRKAKDQCRAFCEIWTRKEAVLKMTGEGISTDLTAFDTSSLPLSDQLYTCGLAGYCLSVCSAEPLGEKRIEISKLELNDLL